MGCGADLDLGADFTEMASRGMAALGQKQSFIPGQPNVRFWGKADIARDGSGGPVQLIALTEGW